MKRKYPIGHIVDALLGRAHRICHAVACLRQPASDFVTLRLATSHRIENMAIDNQHMHSQVLSAALSCLGKFASRAQFIILGNVNIELCLHSSSPSVYPGDMMCRRLWATR